MGQVQALYDRRAAAGEIRPDAAQAGAVAALDGLLQALEERRLRARRGFLPRFLRRPPQPDYRAAQSLYLWGKAGRGKTMLMDLFYQALPEGDKKRIHFNAFMHDAHCRLSAARAAKTPPQDAVAQIAADLAAEAHILCLDEFSVTDIADAMILSRLFSALFARGAVAVITSNTAPQDLYRDGLNRALFLPFLRLLAAKAAVYHLDAPADYRLGGSSAEMPFPAYLTPADAAAKAALDAFWLRLAGPSGGAREWVQSGGRAIAAPRAAVLAPGESLGLGAARGEAGEAETRRAARFDFADICGQNLAAADYAALAERYALFCIDNVPLFDEEDRNQAKRFILLIDTLYDRGRLLCLSAAAEAAALYAGKAAVTEKFEFARAASRLSEMQRPEYWRARL